jgi:3-oxoacyl-[acyl-carrier-protein] synthase-3
LPNTFISGTGPFALANIVKNNFFQKVGSSGEWIYKYLGIKERRISTGGTTSDLASKAGQEAINNKD